MKTDKNNYIENIFIIACAVLITCYGIAILLVGIKELIK